MTGWTYSANFPVTPMPIRRPTLRQPFRRTTGFVSELNPTGTGLVYSTYLGGSTLDEPTTLALDANGNVYTAGYTFSSDYPVTSGAFQTTNISSWRWNAFVTKLNLHAGTGLVYSTYLGGSGESGASTLQRLYAPVALPWTRTATPSWPALRIQAIFR